MPLGNRKKYFRGSKFKKYYPSGNPKFNNLGIFQSLNLPKLMGKILKISHKLNFTPILWTVMGYVPLGFPAF